VMPSLRQALGPDASPTTYRSTACRIGTHHACTESSPESAPVDLPLIYEACACPCHSTLGQSRPGSNAVSDSASTGMPAPNAEITERRTQG
jgi:hypothetical protein